MCGCNSNIGAFTTRNAALPSQQMGLAGNGRVGTTGDFVASLRMKMAEYNAKAAADQKNQKKQRK